MKSNRKDTCRVSLDKNSMGYISDWVTIDNNSQNIFPNQEVTFQFTIKPPAGASENEYPLWLVFNAYDKYSNNHPFSYKILTVIVDNTPPDVPTVSISSRTSTSITIHFNSFDFRSSHYTTNDPTSGVGGIKSYTLVLKNPDNTIKETKSANATDISEYYTFKTLVSNVEYKTTVSTTDLATNFSTSTVVNAATPPAAPANLTATNTTYCSTTLSWLASDGATSYNVYKSTSSSPISTTTTSCTVTGLTSSTPYEMYVEAVSSAGKGDRSKISFTTREVPVPIVSGSTAICSPGTSFTAINQPSGCSIQWDESNNISLLSTSGSTATFRPNGNGSGWIKATYNSGCGSDSAKHGVMVGTPLTPTDIIFTPNPPLCNNQYTIAVVRSENVNCPGLHYSWFGGGHTYVEQNQYGSEAHFSTLPKFPYTTFVYVTATNECGSTTYSELLTVIHCGGTTPPAPAIVIRPNPASTTVQVDISEASNSDSTQTLTKLSTINTETSYTVSIVNSFGQLVYSSKEAGTTFSISVNNLKNGIYSISVTNGKQNFSQKLIVKH